MSFEEKTAEINKKLKCQGCGALLHYQPGTTFLKCDYCGTQNEINQTEEKSIQSVDFDAFSKGIADISNERYTVNAEVVHCNNCGANSTLNPHVTADLCAFCASPLIIDHQLKRVVKPHGLIPFAIDEKYSFTLFKKWAGGLWFAPNDFKRIFSASNHRLKGVYIPFWSYDANADSSYEGQRGEYYYVTRTRRNSDGKTETYQEQRTNWYFASGRIFNQFRDVIVSASTSLPNDFATKLGPWDMSHLKVFDDQYLSGFIAETFTVDHSTGANIAKGLMDEQIRSDVRGDIGGDTQSIDHINTTYSQIKLKYILLPVWLSAYQYKGKSYQIMINAFNGRVYGQRPYSFWKIAFLVIAVLIVVYIFSMMG